MKLPPVFVITCPTQLPSRNLSIQKHLKERKIDFQLFHGVHGKSWGIQATKEYEPGKVISPGHASLIINHWMVWQHCILNHHKEVIIMEDDAVLVDDFEKRYQIIRCNLLTEEDWEFVFLGSVGGERKKVRNYKSINYYNSMGSENTQAIRTIESYPYGTHCYLVSRTGMQFLMRTNQECRRNMDEQIWENSLSKGMHWCQAWPSLASQGSYDGTVPPSCID